MSVRYPQVKKLSSPAALRARMAELGIELPFDEQVDPAGALARSLTVTDGSAGSLEVANRFAVLPMEGWDGTTGGAPTPALLNRTSSRPHSASTSANKARTLSGCFTSVGATSIPEGATAAVFSSSARRRPASTTR